MRQLSMADTWLAAIRLRNKLGIAMAAITNMIAITIRSSMRENPFCWDSIILLSLAGGSFSDRMGAFGSHLLAGILP